MKALYALFALVCASIVVLLVYALAPSSSLESLYCEGGVANGHSDGGACFSFSEARPDTNPETIGSGLWVAEHGPPPTDDGGYAPAPRYAVRRAGKNKYTLYERGELAGTVERDGNWIEITFTSAPGRKYSLRSDRAGVMI